MERGIATLAHQSRPSILFSFTSSNHGGRNRHHDNASVGDVPGASSVDRISSPTGIPARQEEEELEGGYDDHDDQDDDVWFGERDNDEIILEDRNTTRREDDVERAINF